MATVIRYELCERIQRIIYNGQAPDDATVTLNLISKYINDGLAIVAKRNYTDSIQLDGIAYVNNSFYITYRNLSITQNQEKNWVLELPQIPLGLGRNEGISMVQLVSNNNKPSQTAIPLSQNQLGYVDSMKRVPNKIFYWNEGNLLFMQSPLILSNFKAVVRMISGGDSSNLDGVLNIPDDYISQIIDYVLKLLLVERQQPIQVTNEGKDLN